MFSANQSILHQFSNGSSGGLARNHIGICKLGFRGQQFSRIVCTVLYPFGNDILELHIEWNPIILVQLITHVYKYSMRLDFDKYIFILRAIKNT